MTHKEFTVAYDVASKQPIPGNDLVESLTLHLNAHQFTEAELTDLWYISDKIENWAEDADIELTDDQTVVLAMKYQSVKMTKNKLVFNRLVETHIDYGKLDSEAQYKAKVEAITILGYEDKAEDIIAAFFDTIEADGDEEDFEMVLNHYKITL